MARCSSAARVATQRSRVGSERQQTEHDHRDPTHDRRYFELRDQKQRRGRGEQQNLRASWSRGRAGSARLFLGDDPGVYGHANISLVAPTIPAQLAQDIELYPSIGLVTAVDRRALLN